MTITRTKTDLIGTPASPTTITATNSSSGTISLTSNSNTVGCSVVANAITGVSAPTTAITISFAVSYDGTNYSTIRTVSIAAPANSTTYSYAFAVPKEAQICQVTVTNGATNSITAWCQGDVMTVV